MTAITVEFFLEGQPRAGDGKWTKGGGATPSMLGIGVKTAVLANISALAMVKDIGSAGGGFPTDTEIDGWAAGKGIKGKNLDNLKKVVAGNKQTYVDVHHAYNNLADKTPAEMAKLKIRYEALVDHLAKTGGSFSDKDLGAAAKTLGGGNLKDLRSYVLARGNGTDLPVTKAPKIKDAAENLKAAKGDATDDTPAVSAAPSRIRATGPEMHVDDIGNPRIPGTKSAVDVMFADTSLDYGKPKSVRDGRKEQEALESYIGAGHRDMNGLMRDVQGDFDLSEPGTGQRPDGTRERGERGVLATEEGRHIGPLTALIDRNRTTEDVTVFRGSKVNPEDYQPGMTFVDHGFMSTSADFNAARGFGPSSQDLFGDKTDATAGSILVIRLPKGSSAIAYDAMGESEVIVQRGTVYRVVGYSPMPPRGEDSAVIVEVVSQPSFRDVPLDSGTASTIVSMPRAGFG